MLRSRFVLALALVAAVNVASTSALAQESSGGGVRNAPKGTIGLGMLGAELGFIIPVCAGLEETWSLIVFPIVGGAAGAVGGYFAFDRPSGPAFRGLAIGSLVLGMGMVIPTMVITIGKTRYGEDDLGRARRAAGEESEPPPVDEATRMQRSIAAGTGFVRLQQGRLRLAMPGVDVLPLLSVADPTSGPARAGTEIRVSLFSGSF